MAQTYDSTKPTSGVTTFGELYQIIRDKDEALRSNFSGTSFPTDATIGQSCFRTDRGDNGLEYIFTGNTAVGESGWVERATLSTIGIEVINARGSKPTLDQRLDVAINEDGTLKADVAAYQSEWILPSLTFTYVDSTHFTVNGDQTDIYVAKRELKINLSSSYAFTRVSSSVYDADNDNTTVSVADAVIDDTLVSVEHNIIKTAKASLNGSSTEVFEVANAVEDTQAVNKYQALQKIQTDLTVTVGSTGDFATINEAITELSKAYPIYKQLGYNVEIKLLSGFVMEEQIIVNGIDLGWITITGEDDETVISRDALTVGVDAKGLLRYPSFAAINGGTLPTINQLFNMDDSADDNYNYGIFLFNNSNAIILGGAGIKNATMGILAYYKCSAVADGTVFTYAKSTGIYAFTSSIVSATTADVSNAGVYGIYAYKTSIVDFDVGTATNTGSYSVYANRRCTVNAIYSNCTSADTDVDEYFCVSGSWIDISAATGDTATNIDVNTLTSSGIITN